MSGSISIIRSTNRIVLPDWCTIVAAAAVGVVVVVAPYRRWRRCLYPFVAQAAAAVVVVVIIVALYRRWRGLLFKVA